MTLDTYRHELIEAIRLAHSSEEVHQLVENAMTALLQNKVHGHLICRFVDKVMLDIEHPETYSCEKAELNNILTAKKELVALKKYLVEKAN
jgi:energy-converting hydrogenase A subunit M